MGIIGTVAKRKLRIARPVNSTIREAAGGECTAIVLLKLAISYFLHNIPSTPSLKTNPKIALPNKRIETRGNHKTSTKTRRETGNIS